MIVTPTGMFKVQKNTAMETIFFVTQETESILGCLIFEVSKSPTVRHTPSAEIL